MRRTVSLLRLQMDATSATVQWRSVTDDCDAEVTTVSAFSPHHRKMTVLLRHAGSWFRSALFDPNDRAPLLLRSVPFGPAVSANEQEDVVILGSRLLRVRVEPAVYGVHVIRVEFVCDDIVYGEEGCLQEPTTK
ncbi:MAG: hypothetical protein JWN63_3030 [Candidatus Acidoferrum typicum]|nr:hypothetical protein [Candidatus Acidoferrum typicum]